MPTLDREQRGIVAELDRQAKYVPRRLRPIYRRAAVQTGLVESGLRNLNRGDRDSLGWRQERTSLYPNPRNVRASARRFRQEFMQHYDPGERSYEVAAQVQRPAAQYRDRYRQEAGEAAAIVRKYMGRGGGGSSPGRGGGGMGLGSLADELGPLGLSSLGGLLGGRPQPPVSGPALPAFAAAAPTPNGAPLPVPSSAPAPRRDPLAALMQLAAQGGDLGLTPLKGGGGRRRGGGGGGGRGVSEGDGEIHELFYNGPGGINIDEGKRVGRGFVSGHTGHVHFAADRESMREAARIAKRMGLHVGEYGRGIRSGHAPNSFHYQPFGAMDVSGGSPSQLRRFNRRVARLGR